MPDSVPAPPAGGPAKVTRAPREALAGLFLIAVAGVALWQGADLAMGSLRHFGPGMVPRALAWAVGGCGALVLAGALFRADGEGMERLSWRGPLFVIGGAVGFGLAVRPLGLLVAAPLLIVVAAFATPDARWRQSVVAAAILAAFCIALFRFGLGLAIPVAPWLVGY